MKKIVYLLILIFLPICTWSQFIDVYQKKNYEISTYVLSENFKLDYAPSQLEIYQDKDRNGSTQWKAIEDKLYSIAIQNIKNEVEFFKIHSKAKKRNDQIEESIVLLGQNYGNEMSSSGFDFKKLEIQLLSVVNGFGVYAIRYNFDIRGNSNYQAVDEFSITKIYLADYQKGSIKEIGDSPTPPQQNAIKKAILPQLKMLYLLQTQKLELNEVERIRTIEKQEEIDFSDKIDFSEALVYPLFSGILVEFPQYSVSSRIFDNQPFRILLKENEIDDIRKNYPEFSAVLPSKMKATSQEMIDKLNRNESFELNRFQLPPKEEGILNILNLNKNIKNLSIQNHYMSDTVKVKSGSITYEYDIHQKLQKIESRNDRDEIVKTINYFYDGPDLIAQTTASNHTNNLVLYFNQNGILTTKNNIEKKFYGDTYGGRTMKLVFEQEHIIYFGNRRYSFTLDLVGKVKPKEYRIWERSIEGNEFCTQFACILTDSNQRVIGVKNKRNSIVEVLTNSKNQPLEFYYDRYHNVFEYDDWDRIKTFETYEARKLKKTMEYHYKTDKIQPLTITENGSSNLIQDYYLEYWE